MLLRSTGLSVDMDMDRTGAMTDVDRERGGTMRDTAGTAVAARLSEDASLKILVIEAGNDSRADPAVFDIYQYGAALRTPLDWAWETDRGKVIRGCVALLLLGFSRADGAGYSGGRRSEGAQRSTAGRGRVGSSSSTMRGLRCSSRMRWTWGGTGTTSSGT